MTGDAALERHSRSGRHYNGRNAKALLLRTGDATLEAPPGSREVARARAPAPLISESCRGSRPRSRSTWRQGRLRLDLAGKRRSSAAALPSLAQVQGAGADLRTLFTSRELDVMIREHFLVLDNVVEALREAHADLQHQWDQQTVALFVAPLHRQGDEHRAGDCDRP